jgi:dephospho-CoA kinase
MQTIPTPYKIAIIGGIGSGKSVVSRLLTTMGIPVYDCDSRAKHLMNMSPILRSALIEVVGAAVYSADGHINRPYLANYMFGHPERVTQINHIVHPTVRADFEAWANSSASPLVAVETAILYESGMDADVDAIILVHAPMEMRLQRAMQRDHADEPSIRHRMSHQMTDNELLQRATHIIRNDERHSLIAQVQQLIATLTEQNS